ncbi:MAG TPA: ribose-5-phosphate isomerase RpiA [Tepidisphaeraceae bacterium]|nr:ribose-5-phosphate isomerase RpiA [Tepidisphaeraceae bacterium]
MDPKQRTGEAAVELVTSNMVVGLGTGSTADFFLVALSRAIGMGKIRNIRGIPTSKKSEHRAKDLGIPLVSLAQYPHPDITIDGADEVNPRVDVIKGLGGALLREKIVAQNSRQFVIIVDSSKRVDFLGQKSPLPVEVAIFGFETHEAFLKSLGGNPVLRKDATGSPFVTDNGNYIYDCRFTKIDKPAELQQTIKTRAGIVETGLFVGMASAALIGSDGKVETITRGG